MWEHLFQVFESDAQTEAYDYSTAQANMVCGLAEAGFITNPTKDGIVACEAGSFKVAGELILECSPCPAGAISDKMAASKCDPCAAAEYSAGDAQGLGGKACAPCFTAAVMFGVTAPGFAIQSGDVGQCKATIKMISGMVGGLIMLIMLCVICKKCCKRKKTGLDGLDSHEDTKSLKGKRTGSDYGYSSGDSADSGSDDEDVSFRVVNANINGPRTTSVEKTSSPSGGAARTYSQINRESMDDTDTDRPTIASFDAHPDDVDRNSMV